MYSTSLSEQDVRLFLKEPVSIRGIVRKSAQVGVAFGLTLGIGYGLLNYNALLRIYLPTSSTPVTAAQVTPLPTAAPGTTVKPTPVVLPSTPENTVSLSSIGLSSPITWDVPMDEGTIQKDLLNGVVHLAGTAKPGEQGTVVITGHSSNYPWVKGQYNTIFAPLHNVKTGDAIILNYDNKEFTYKVSKVYQVKPTDLSVLQAGSKGSVRLITCTPVGTSLRRLIVEAEQISPDPAQNTPFTHQINTTIVPGAR